MVREKTEKARQQALHETLRATGAAAKPEPEQTNERDGASGGTKEVAARENVDLVTLTLTAVSVDKPTFAQLCPTPYDATILGSRPAIRH